MRILFATDQRAKISTQLNVPNYEKLNQLDGVSIDFYNHNYADYDVVLFMGYDPRVAEARAANPSIKIGIIDLRFMDIDDARGADFVIANGVEVSDWLSIYFENIFIYPIYPQVNAPLKKHIQNKPLILGYHGNKLHLVAMQPDIVAAIEALSEHYEVELWAVYDIRSHGEMMSYLCDPTKVKVRYFQWEEDIYERIIAQVDIGIVPNLIPLKYEGRAKQLAEPYSSLIPSNPYADYLLRFKKTTNAGRIYVFSQLGIPVVAGMSPSAAQAISHGEGGYLALSAAGWYHGLKKLADSSELRIQMGSRLYLDFQNKIAPAALNRKLVDFIQQLPSSVTPLSSFHQTLQKADTSVGIKRPISTALFKRLTTSIKRFVFQYSKGAGSK